MTNLFLVPQWFYGYDIALELLFALITLAVGLVALKVHRLSSQAQVKLFGYSFLLIASSYFFKSVINFLILSKIRGGTCTACKISDILLYDNIGMIGYMILFAIGLGTIGYMTLKIDNWKAHTLLILILALAIIFSINKVYIFYLLSSILLVYILGYYIYNFIKNKQRKVILIIIAFSFLLFGSIHFLISVNHSIFYVIGHVLELVAYALILLNLLLAIKK